MRLEQITRHYEETPKEEEVFYNRFELYLFGAIQFYTIGGSGPLGGNFASRPLSFARDFGRESIFDRMNRLAASRPLTLEQKGSSFKVFSPDTSTPLLRLDLKPHEFGKPHLQYGEDLFTGRTGEEASDIFAQILKTSRHNIRWPK